MSAVRTPSASPSGRADMPLGPTSRCVRKPSGRSPDSWCGTAARSGGGVSASRWPPSNAREGGSILLFFRLAAQSPYAEATSTARPTAPPPVRHRPSDTARRPSVGSHDASRSRCDPSRDCSSDCGLLLSAWQSPVLPKLASPRLDECLYAAAGACDGSHDASASPCDGSSDRGRRLIRRQLPALPRPAPPLRRAPAGQLHPSEMPQGAVVTVRVTLQKVLVTLQQAVVTVGVTPRTEPI